MPSGDATMITGASSGIGAAIALELASSGDGDKLILVGRNRERIENIAQRCRDKGAEVTVVVADLTERVALFSIVDSLQATMTIHRLIACAGILDGRRAEAVVETPQAAATVLDTNLNATVDLVYRLLPGMLARRNGEIALVSSLAALSPIADAPAYSASKAGMVAFGLALREAVRGEGLKVTIACPGYVDTAMGGIHKGNRPHEVAPHIAATKILKAMRADRALSGFPFFLYWLARLSVFSPEFIRRLGAKGLRFHVSSKPD